MKVYIINTINCIGTIDDPEHGPAIMLFVSSEHAREFCEYRNLPEYWIFEVPDVLVLSENNVALVERWDAYQVFYTIYTAKKKNEGLNGDSITQ